MSTKGMVMLSLHVCIICVNIRNVELHLSQLNYFCFMQLASSKHFAKESNSVSTQGKEKLSLHVRSKYVGNVLSSCVLQNFSFLVSVRLSLAPSPPP